MDGVIKGKGREDGDEVGGVGEEERGGKRSAKRELDILVVCTRYELELEAKREEEGEVEEIRKDDGEEEEERKEAEESGLEEKEVVGEGSKDESKGK